MAEPPPPAEVHALTIEAPGLDTPLRAHPAPATPPAPRRGQVRLRLEAAGVCHRDLIDRAGRIPWLSPPVVPGHEGVGVVEAVGEGVSRWSVGDRVGTLHRDACGACASCLAGRPSLCEAAAHIFGLTADGTYSRSLLAPESALYAVPEGLPAAEAAVLHCTFGTAWRSLVTVGGLRAGEQVLVTGANGGVGVAGVQIAARLGARVVAQVRSERHVGLLRDLGAHEVIVVRDGRIHAASAAALGSDLALDCVGAPVFASVLRCLRVGGRVAVVGNVTEERVPVNLGQLIVMGLRVLGAGGADAADMAAVLAEHARSPFRVPLHATLPLAEAEAAQARLREGGVQGRIVLLP